MKQHSGCLRRILSSFILLGFLAAVTLGYLGYRKAETAEAEKTSINQLYTVYAGNSSGEKINPDLLDTILNGVIGDNVLLQKIRAGFGNDAIAEMITDSYYLADDNEISTAIGQRILIHRLKQAYTETELLQIYCGIHGYNLTDLNDMQNLPQRNDTENADTVLNKAAPLLQDMLNYLQEQNIIPEEKAAEIEELIQNNL